MQTPFSGRTASQFQLLCWTFRTTAFYGSLNDTNFNSPICAGNHKPPIIHHEGFNMAFTDGHVRCRHPDTLVKGDFCFSAADCP